MADGKLKIYNGKLLITGTGKLATADACCCETCCPTDVTAYMLTGHFAFYEDDCTTLICEDDFAIAISPSGDGCTWSGLEDPCSVQFGAILTQTGTFPDCEWGLFNENLSPGPAVFKPGGIVGAYPDYSIVPPDSGLFCYKYTSLVVS